MTDLDTKDPAAGLVGRAGETAGGTPIATGGLAVAREKPRGLPAGAWALIILGPFVGLVLWHRFARSSFPDWASVIAEESRIPFVDWINSFIGYLRNEEIFGLFSFRSLSRTVAGWLEWPLDFIGEMLTTGYEPWGLPAIPWTVVVGFAGILGHRFGGWRLAVGAALCMLYLAVFGIWELSMISLSTVLIAAPLATFIGWVLGLAAAKSSRFEAILNPILNLAQATPHFAYFIPIAIFVAVSPRAGVIAMAIYAVPPMARLTTLGLRSVPSEVLEAGTMSGATKWQQLWKVEMPSARPSLLVGVNQVIMQCFGMHVLASFVGGPGLPKRLLNFLQSLRIGDALEVGVAIVLMALMLDRLSQAAGRQVPEHSEEQLPFWREHPHVMATIALVAGAAILAQVGDWATIYPDGATISTSDFWDAIVDYVQTSWDGVLGAIKDFTVINILIPMRDGFSAIPWLAMAALVAAAGWKLGGWRLAALTASFVAFIAFSGFWVEAMESLYLAVAAVIISVVVGVPIGIWAAGSDRRTSAMSAVLDFFQVLPSFIYLIPVVMLFQVGPMAALVAILVYAFVPSIRYTMLGIRGVPHDVIEAAETSGCNRRQTLLKAKLPMALPEIALGVNQVLMFSLLMVMLAAFIGGINGLGDEILIALRDQDAGKGLVVGFCLAFMGLTADQLLRAWSRDRKAQLGIE